MGCLRQTVAFGIPLADAVRASSYNPAQSIGIDDRAGSLEVGEKGQYGVVGQGGFVRACDPLQRECRGLEVKKMS